MQGIHTSQRGFTLIELSMVLVIIGFIAAGILVGQSLIQSAQVVRFASDIQRYQTAFNAFYGKYNCLPGDCVNATTFFGVASPAGCYASNQGPVLVGNTSGTCNGNGDGEITWYGGIQGETFMVWQQLAQAGMIAGSYNGTLPGSGGAVLSPGVNVPAAAAFNQIYTVTWTSASANGWVNTLVGSSNFLLLSAIHADQVDVTYTLPAVVASRIDLKIDDGIPGTGKMFAIGSWCKTSNDATTAVYAVDSAFGPQGCKLFYQLQ